MKIFNILCKIFNFNVKYAIIDPVSHNATIEKTYFMGRLMSLFQKNCVPLWYAKMYCKIKKWPLIDYSKINII